MINKEKVAILIPAYNPSEDLIEFATELSNEFKIIIVDDGSEEKDIFIKLDAACCANIVTHLDNLGKGGALKTGFRHVLQNYSEIEFVVTADADGQHSIPDISKVLNYLDMSNNGITIGSREFGADTPIKSKIGNYTTKYLFWLLTGVKLNDTQTGLRVFPIDLLEHLVSLEGDHFEFELEVLVWCVVNQIKINEVFIDAIYFNKNEKTNFKPIIDSLKIYKVFWGYIFQKRYFRAISGFKNNSRLN